MKNRRGSATALKIPLMKPISSSSRQQLQRSADAAVFSHPPEVYGHQHRDAERQADAVQHVEAQQRAFTDERPAEQREPRIVGRMNQFHVAEREERRARTLV